MKKISFLLLLIAAFFAQAQVHQFIYEYKYVPLPEKKDSAITEMMSLDITDTGSLYQSAVTRQRASLLRTVVSKQFNSGGEINLTGLPRPKVPYSVSKEYPTYKTFLINRVGMDLYKIAEDEKQVWKILPDKQKIGAYNAQKATTEWGGRSWTAWFDSSIPFQDGPYKFSGLPGLIVKLEDATGNHVMTLIGNKKIAAPSSSKDDAKSGFVMSIGGNPINVSEAQYRKAWKSYVADPSAAFKTRSSSMGAGFSTTTVMTMRGPDGKTMTPKEMEEGRKKGAATQNKINMAGIEPSLYQ